MSGAMVNLGVLGVIIFCGTSQAAVGWVLAVLGFAGTLIGIMFSLTKRNIKAVLAYSTIENCGIISSGIGCGILGGIYKLPGLEVFGYLAAFMHLLNHASLKGALFLASGSVFQATGTLDADKLGGVIRKMPSTGKMFILSSLGLAGIPPFNAFISELILYVALFSGLAGSGVIPVTVLCASGIIILGASGAFALASLVRISSGVFLGEPRDLQLFENAKNEDPVMGRAVFISLVPALVLTLCPVWMAMVIFDASGTLFTIPQELQLTAIQRITGILKAVGCMNWILIASISVIYLFIRSAVKKRNLLAGPTWDCGYAKPTGRMQYTSSALVQNITDFFSPVFGIAVRRRGDALSNEQGSDIADRLFWNLLFKITARWSERIHKFQTGYLHFYILVMVSALAALLLWAYCSGGAK